MKYEGKKKIVERSVKNSRRNN